MDPIAAASPSVLKAVLLLLARRIAGREPAFRIEWRETLWDMLARFIGGLVLGAIFAFFLVPAIFWPSRRSRGKTFFGALGEPGWIGYVFLGVWLGTALVMSLRTKARLYHRDPARTDPPLI